MRKLAAMDSSIRRAIEIARFTVLESLRSRTVFLAGWMALGALGVAAFISQVAMTEAAEVQSAIIAAVLRVCAVFLLATFVVSSIVREQADKIIELVLSQALPRWAYVLGKLGGFTAAALLLGLVFCLPLVLLAPVARVAVWGFSLCIEMALVAALALFCVLTLANTVTALAVVAGFYVLARAIGAIQVIASASADSNQLADVILLKGTQGLAWLLPNLDRATQAAWLTAPVLQIEGLGLLLLQAASSMLLLVVATMFDFQRQNF